MTYAHKLSKAFGGTTLCVLTLDNQQLLLRSALVGDSGYAIYRLFENKFSLFFKSRPDLIGYNFPY